MLEDMLARAAMPPMVPKTPPTRNQLEVAAEHVVAELAKTDPAMDSVVIPDVVKHVADYLGVLSSRWSRGAQMRRLSSSSESICFGQTLRWRHSKLARRARRHRKLHRRAW